MNQTLRNKKALSIGGGVAGPVTAMALQRETAAALAREGRNNRKGMPNPLVLALFVREFEREVWAPLAPVGLVRAVMAPLAWLAAGQGLDKRYEQSNPAVPAVEERRLAGSASISGETSVPAH